ncbi:ankyrin repeat domain-containing protein 53 [Leptodactylus fuscus]|uniref:ankyrin repeat domain-containing protein 53 n=1 Tax=Leptodactylus fuscus TaxID=238119 RepID=UPI003F4E4558
MNVLRDQLMAASIGNVDWLQLSMKMADSPAKADRYGFTVLHMAAIHGRLQCLKLLLEDYGMDVNVASVYGWRALHLVMNQKSGGRAVQCLRYLLQQGADVNVRSTDLTTPLHRAASEGLDHCIAELVNAGADVHAKDSEGRTAMDLCHVWCHRSAARFLRSAMWKKDKEDYTRGIRKMEKIRRDIEGREEDVSTKMETPSCDSTKTEKSNKIYLKMETSPKSKPTDRCMDPRYNQGANGTMEKAGTEKDVRMAKARGKQASDGRTSPPRKSSWNVSTNLQRPPTLHINRVPTPWQGTYTEEVTKKDLSSNVLLTKDGHGQLQIQTLRGQVFSAPNLPYEVIERSLFPKRGPQDRIQTPKSFRATHVFDVPRKQQPAESQRPESEVSFHLRRNLHSKFSHIGSPHN